VQSCSPVGEPCSHDAGIRRAVLEGDIDRALKDTMRYYPTVLEKNEQVRFKLRCRKFVEMVRREAELNLMGGDRRNNGHHQDMEIDDMDMEGGGENQDLADEALTYGQNLAAEYSDDRREEVIKALQDIFSLMAYTNPLKEKEVEHLLDRKGRAAVAEELNSAILRASPSLSVPTMPPADPRAQNPSASRRGRGSRTSTLRPRFCCKIFGPTAALAHLSPCSTSWTRSPSPSYSERCAFLTSPRRSQRCQPCPFDAFCRTLPSPYPPPHHTVRALLVFMYCLSFQPRSAGSLDGAFVHAASGVGGG